MIPSNTPDDSDSRSWKPPLDPMPHLPTPENYELEYEYLPWGRLIAAAENWLVDNTPESGHVVDYMCGTGFLLHRVWLRRPDLTLWGCTLEPRSYINYARKMYPGIHIEYADARVYKPPIQPTVAVCTGGLHHLPRADQESFLRKVATDLRPSGYFVLGEELVRMSGTEADRRIAVLELWNALASHGIMAGAPDGVVSALIGILENDLLALGEFKIDKGTLTQMLEDRFYLQNCEQTWPDPPNDYGDFLFIVRRLG